MKLKGLHPVVLIGLRVCERGRWYRRLLPFRFDCRRHVLFNIQHHNLTLLFSVKSEKVLQYWRCEKRKRRSVTLPPQIRLLNLPLSSFASGLSSYRPRAQNAA